MIFNGIKTDKNNLLTGRSFDSKKINYEDELKSLKPSKENKRISRK